ncbi:MAG: helix-turn-helix transcriptional regulator, partial [Clostridia bacterium]|nr:helix-turn-helix transcriptional regulator [Clostridia bacterium]
MNYSQYENYGFERFSAFNLSTGHAGRSYQAHWHSYGEILLAGPGETNVFQINRDTYKLTEGDFLLIWPMEMHAIIDADRKESLVIQFSNAFINSLFDLRRIIHFYRNMHVLCINAHRELVSQLRAIADSMKEIFFSAEPDKELRCCMLLMEFMLTLDRHREEFAPEMQNTAVYGYTDTVMRRMILVTEYIKNNLTADNLSQSAMAEMAGISKEYFSRIFRSVTGMNYSKWLNMIRLEKATELLADKEKTMTEVAMLSG